jgi:hypothetical protein
MKYFLYLIIHLTLLTFVSNKVMAQKDFFIINFEKSLIDKKKINLSQLASNVEYIQLETNPDCLLNQKSRFFFVDSLIFVSNKDHILKFSINGKFLKKIGKPGRGPGEIGTIADLSIIPNKRQIIVQLLEKRSLLYFSFDGRFIKSINLPYRGIVKTINDGKILVWDRGSLMNAKLTFLLTNERGDTLSSVPNYTTIIKGSSISAAPSYSFFPEHFYYFNNNFFFKDEYNDTVYSVKSNKIVPQYFINLGKFKLPDNLNPSNIGPSNMEKYLREAKNHYFCTSFELANKVFVTSHSYNKGVPKLVLYDKSLHQENLLINNEGSSTGLINDWDSGSDFWPVGCVSSSKVYMPIDINKLQTEFKKNKANQALIKFPEKQKQLEKIITGLDILNNPIIMIVTLK